MSYEVSFSLEAVEDVLRITLASQAKPAVSLGRRPKLTVAWARAQVRPRNE